MPRVVGPHQYRGVADDRRYRSSDVLRIRRTQDGQTAAVSVAPSEGEKSLSMTAQRYGSIARLCCAIRFRSIMVSLDSIHAKRRSMESMARVHLPSVSQSRLA